MHNKHVCPEYAGDCKDQFPVFSPVGINKKDLDGMIPVFSTIGRGPRGEGVTVKQLGDGSYQFISTTTGEVVSEVPVLDVGTFEVINNTPNPVGSEPISVTIRHTFGGEVKECNLAIPSGEDGASVHTCSALLDKNESNRYSLLLSSFTATPAVRDSVLFKTVDGEDEFLTFGEVYSVAAKTVGVNALSYLGAGWDSPNIGDNGNWWVGNSDTGIPATGPKGEGLPEGGEVGQVMTKTESGPQWVDVSMPDEWPLPVDKGGTGAIDAAEARSNLDVYSKSEVDERGVRAGFIYVNPSDDLPDGFLWCDGAEHSRAEYPELFAAIGTTFGAGDGLTTFNVPDMRGRVPVGAGDGYSIGATGGEAEHTLIVEEMPNHGHPEQRTTSASTGQKDGYIMLGGYSADGSISSVGLQGGDQPHNNMQPYTVVNYIISTGNGTGVSVDDIIRGATTLPLSVEYGGTGATTAAGARESLGALGVSSYGKSDNWRYIKFENGLAMCWQHVRANNLAVNQVWGGHYYNTIFAVDYPFVFADSPALSALVSGSSNVFVANTVGNSERSTGQFSIISPVSITESFYLSVMAIGKWK